MDWEEEGWISIKFPNVDAEAITLLGYQRQRRRETKRNDVGEGIATIRSDTQKSSYCDSCYPSSLVCD
jgi:hypothetical protein